MNRDSQEKILNTLIFLMSEAVDRNMQAMILQSYISEFGPVPDEYGDIIKKLIEEKG